MNNNLLGTRLYHFNCFVSICSIILFALKTTKMMKKVRNERHLPDSCCRLSRNVDSLERIKKEELPANTLAFIGTKKTYTQRLLQF